jgi:hypothetical protein
VFKRGYPYCRLLVAIIIAVLNLGTDQTLALLFLCFVGGLCASDGINNTPFFSYFLRKVGSSINVSLDCSLFVSVLNLTFNLSREISSIN